MAKNSSHSLPDTDQGLMERSDCVALWTQVVRHAKSTPQHPAIFYMGSTITYAELVCSAFTLSQRLGAEGIKAGDRIALLSANHPAYVSLLLAASLMGVTIVPINTRLGSTDLASALQRCDPRLVIVGENFRRHDYGKLIQSAQDHLNETGADASFIVRSSSVLLDISSSKSSEEMLPSIPDQAMLTRGTAPLLIIFTSGSSGHPKPVMIGATQVVRMMARYGERMGLEAQDRVLSCMPYFHVYGGVITVITALISGSTIVMLPAFDATETLRAVSELRCTVIFGTAETYRYWFDHPDFSAYDLSSVRTGQWSGGPSGLRLETAKKVNAMLCPMHAIFGMTETLGVATMTHQGDTFEVAGMTAGKPMPGVELKIVDPQTRLPVADGETGLLLVRGECVTPGYFKSPDLTAAAFDTEGWFNTGDLARFDVQGNLCIAGRNDDRLRCGGENIDVDELQAFIETHPAVRQCQVVGVPDRRLTEVPVAFVTLLSDTEMLTEDELTAYCQGKIADFKIPRRFFVVDRFPGFMHKVQKGRLKEDAINRMGIVLSSQA